MKLFALATAAIVTVASASSALAASQFEIEAQNTLDKYGFSVDAGSLSGPQLVAVNGADNDSDRTRVEIQAAIASAVNG